MHDVETLPEQETRPEVKPGGGTGKARVRHYVELDAEGRPTDECLCGYIWDRVFVKHDPDAGICQECVDELRRRQQQGR